MFDNPSTTKDTLLGQINMDSIGSFIHANANANRLLAEEWTACGVARQSRFENFAEVRNTSPIYHRLHPLRVGGKKYEF